MNIKTQDLKEEHFISNWQVPYWMQWIYSQTFNEKAQ